jgi:hypothetical protein
MTLSLEDTSKRLAEKDETLWGSAARATARERLGWIDLQKILAIYSLRWMHFQRGREVSN